MSPCTSSTEAVVGKVRDAYLPKADSTSCRPTFYACVDQQRNALQPAAVTKACAVAGAGP